jgi:hypothetical protein
MSDKEKKQSGTKEQPQIAVGTVFNTNTGEVTWVGEVTTHPDGKQTERQVFPVEE